MLRDTTLLRPLVRTSFLPLRGVRLRLIYVFTEAAPRRVHSVFTPVHTTHRLSGEKNWNYYSSSLPFQLWTS